MAKEQTITVPDIGNNKDVSIIEVLVKVGDIIGKEDSIITLESDKAAMEIPSPRGGEVKQVLVKVGDKVSRGSPVLVLAGAEDGPALAMAQPTPAPVPATAQIATPSATASRSGVGSGPPLLESGGAGADAGAGIAVCLGRKCCARR